MKINLIITFLVFSSIAVANDKNLKIWKLPKAANYKTTAVLYLEQSNILKKDCVDFKKSIFDSSNNLKENTLEELEDLRLMPVIIQKNQESFATAIIEDNSTLNIDINEKENSFEESFLPYSKYKKLHVYFDMFSLKKIQVIPTENSYTALYRNRNLLSSDVKIDKNQILNFSHRDLFCDFIEGTVELFVKADVYVHLDHEDLQIVKKYLSDLAAKTDTIIKTEDDPKIRAVKWGAEMSGHSDQDIDFLAQYLFDPLTFDYSENWFSFDSKKLINFEKKYLLKNQIIKIEYRDAL